MKRYFEALECIEEAIKKYPQESIGYFNKGNVLLLLKRYEEALKHYDYAIQKNPRNS